MSVRIRIERNDYANLAKALPSATGRAVQASAQRLAADARARAPARTGALRASIEAVRQGRGWAVVAAAAYAVFVEHGTSRMAARPFLTPAAEAERPRFLDALDRLLRRATP